MRFISTKNTLGKIKNALSTLALGFLVVGTAQAEILDFQAQSNQCNAELSWVSNDDINISSYEVQKSIDGINFTTLTTIRRGTSNTYNFTARQSEAQARYRIVENYRNTFPTMSTVRFVKTSCNAGSIDSPAIGFYPNPLLNSIGGDLHITLENENATMLNIQITDITGRVILKQENELHRGLNQIDMNVGELAVGSYLIVTSTDGGAPKAERFIVQK
jgi:hypothetical protein